MAIQIYQFLNQSGLTFLATELLTKTNIRIDSRIIATIDETATDKQLPSAKALYSLLTDIQNNSIELSDRIDDHDTQISNNSSSISTLEESQTAQNEKLTTVESELSNLNSKVTDLTHLTIETITGNIDSVTEPKDDVLYFQRDNEADTMWMLYIYQAGAWVNIGDTEVDLSNIWSKDETNLLKEELIIHNAEGIPNDALVSIAESAYNSNTVELRSTPTGGPTISSIETGSSLSEHPISGSMIYGDIEVPGTFTWTTSDEEFEALVDA